MTGPDRAPAGDLAAAAVGVLRTADPHAKAEAALAMAAAWRAGGLAPPGPADPPERPARPERPALLPPGSVPRRRLGSPAGRVALLHALAHIELNAVDLACDIVARFGAPLPRGFSDDWVGVAADEARHFLLLSARLAAYGAAYGDLPAHDGLWQAATVTADDVLARLAIVPLVLEARGLDVTPAMIGNLRAAGDLESAAALQTIHDEEIGHVAAGRRWFDHVAAARGLGDPQAAWQELVQRLFRGQLKRPFNEPSRSRANLPPDWYEPLADL